MSDEKIITIEGVYGIKDRFEIKLRPGINRFIGRHGAGKTSCYLAILSLCGIRPPLDLELHESVNKGKIEGLGREIDLDKGMMHKRGRLALEFEGEAYKALGQLIKPRGVNPDAVAKERLQALSHFVQVPIDEELVLELAGGDADFAATAMAELSGKQIELIGLSRRVAKVIHDQKRVAAAEQDREEGQATAKDDEIQECLARLPDGVVETSVEEAEKVVGYFDEMFRAAQHALKERRILEQRQDEIRREFELSDQQPVPVETVEDEIGTLTEERHKLDLKIVALEADLGAAKQRRNDLEARIAAEQERLKNLKREHRQYAERREILARPLSDASQETVDRMTERLAAAKKGREIAELSAKVRKLKTDAAMHREAARRAKSKAEALEAFAQGTPDRLATVLRKHTRGVGGFTIKSGELYIETTTGWRSFAKCSTGEQVEFGVSLAARRWGALIPLTEEHYNAFDPEQRKELNRRVSEAGLYLVTAEYNHSGDLRLAYGTSGEGREP